MINESPNKSLHHEVKGLWLVGEETREGRWAGREVEPPSLPTRLLASFLTSSLLPSTVSNSNPMLAQRPCPCPPTSHLHVVGTDIEIRRLWVSREGL